MLRYLYCLGGLVLWTSPLFAQDYIDLEQERLQQQSGGEFVETISLDPETAGPETAGPGAAGSVTLDPVAAEPATTSNAGELFYQIQILQQEMMELRGQLEEQGHQLRQLKEQSLERYMDLDRRLKDGGGATAAPAGGQTGQTGRPTTGTQPVQELAGESDAYRSAYSLVRSQQFNDAVSAFRQFLQEFPNGKYAANAHYWLGELFLVIVPPNPESARREFNLLLQDFPDNGKVPDALYKLGKIYYEKGNCERSREYLERVIKEFGDTGSSAVKLARDLLSQSCPG
ncbi:MAG: tol-pal system protein YbgF [Halieaceae bacterium]